MNTIKKGNKGEEVRELLKYLKNLGYNILIDGVFGEVTEEIVKDYQMLHKLGSDGVVGSKTWEHLKSKCTSTHIILPKRKINDIILHCSATPEGKDYTTNDIDKWHKQRGFTKIGYHYVIYRDGSVHNGREESEIGAHCSGHNSYSIGISYIGGCDVTGKKAKDTRTEAQKKTLITLVKQLLAKYNLSINNVHCHNQYNSKACPSFSIETFKKEYK